MGESYGTSASRFSKLRLITLALSTRNVGPPALFATIDTAGPPDERVQALLDSVQWACPVGEDYRLASSPTLLAVYACDSLYALRLPQSSFEPHDSLELVSKISCNGGPKFVQLKR